MIKPNKFREYPEKGILSKMPSDFIGIAKEYSSVKKQRIMSQQLFDNYHHEVSSIQKINKNLAKSLNKKKKELKYVQAVRSRYISEVMQKQKLQELKQLELSRLRNKTIQQKSSTDLKLAQARQRLMFRKKTQCELTKKQLNHYKSQKCLEDSRLLQKNQSRVQQIEEQKARIKEYYNRFFQNKNRKFMQNYKKLINSEKSKEQNYKIETKNLQRKLLLLKEDAKKKEQLLADLNSSIDSIKESRQSLRSSRQGSTRSMTPMEILTAGRENPEKVKLRLVNKI